MPDTTDGDGDSDAATTSDPQHRAPTPHASSPEPTSRWGRWSNPGRLATIAVVVAIIGAGIAVVTLIMTLRTPSYTAQQTTAATTRVCAAFTLVRDGVVSNTHLANPTPGNPAGQLAVAANARLALLGGGAFLRDRLTTEPATPPSIADNVTALADTIEELGAAYLADTNTSLAQLRHNLDDHITQLSKLCTPS